MAITALGTEFNVKAYPEEDIITTSLIEGKYEWTVMIRLVMF